MIEGVRPFREWILVRRRPADEKIGSIVIPDSSRARATFGEVVDVGLGELIAVRDGSPEYLPVSGIEKGARVFFSSRAGNDIKIDGDDIFTMLLPHEVMATLPEAPNGSS